MKYFNYIIHAVLFPVLISTIMHYGYCTNYTTGTFNIDGFNKQYESGVFQYRIIGRNMVKLVYEYMDGDSGIPKTIKHIVKSTPLKINGSDNKLFYASNFIANTISFVIMSMFLYALMSHTRGYILTIFIIAITMFVVTPYDMLHYAFIAAFIYVVHENTNIAIMLGLIVTGTLVRETMLLVIPYYLIHHNNKKILNTVIMLSVYIITYLGIRYVYSTGVPVIDTISNTGIIILSTVNRWQTWCGILFSLTITYMVARNNSNGIKYLVYTIPYLIYILFVAQLWEVRLWVPVWIGIITMGVADE